MEGMEAFDWGDMPTEEIDAFLQDISTIMQPAGSVTATEGMETFESPSPAPQALQADGNLEQSVSLCLDGTTPPKSKRIKFSS